MLFDLKHTQEVPTKTFYDNKSTITLTNKLIFHGRNKHVDIKFHYICDWWKKNYGWVLFFRKSNCNHFYEVNQGENIAEGEEDGGYYNEIWRT